MPDGNAFFALGRSMPSHWPVRETAPQQAQAAPGGWRIRKWFARRETTLFQRCLAVHIYHASKQSSLR